MKKNKSNVGLVIALIIFIVLSLVLSSYLVYDKLINKEKNNEVKVEEQEKNNEGKVEEQEENTKQKEQDETAELKNYEISDVIDANDVIGIEIVSPMSSYTGDMYIRTASISNEKEIKEILSNLDKKEKVEKITDGIGFISEVSMTIKYEKKPSTVIVFMDNGNLAINFESETENSGYTEYKIENKNLVSELTDKYLGK